MKRTKTAILALVSSSLLIVACDEPEPDETSSDALEFRSGSPIAEFDGIHYYNERKPVDRDNLLANCTLEFEVHDASGTVILDDLVISTSQAGAQGNVDKMQLEAVFGEEGFDFFADRNISAPIPPAGGQLTYLGLVVIAGLNWPVIGQSWTASIVATHDVGGPTSDWQSVAWDGDLEVVSHCS